MEAGRTLERRWADFTVQVSFDEGTNFLVVGVQNDGPTLHDVWINFVIPRSVAPSMVRMNIRRLPADGALSFTSEELGTGIGESVYWNEQGLTFPPFSSCLLSFNAALHENPGAAPVRFGFTADELQRWLQFTTTLGAGQVAADPDED